MIEGVKITPLKQIFDERGKVMHMLEVTTKFYKIWEIYFHVPIQVRLKACICIKNDFELCSYSWCN